MVPVLSYLLLRGKCSQCGAPIPVRLFVVELLTGLLFTAAYWKYGLGIELVYVCASVALFLAVAIIDLEHQRIPDRIVFPSLAITLLAAPFWTKLGLPRTFFGNAAMTGSFLNSVASGLGAFLLFFPVLLAFPQGFGFGDVKLAGLMGMLLGFPAVAMALWVGIVSGGVLAIVLLALRKKGRKDTLPFGLFLSLAGIAVLLVGSETIASFYVDQVYKFAGV